MLRTTTLIAASGLLLTTLMGCSEPEPSAVTAPATRAAALEQATTSPANAVDRIEQARDLHKTSVELGFAWVATGKHLQAAEKALEAGDEAAALAAAEQAVALARASITQAETEAEAWQGRLPFNQTGNQGSSD